MIKNFQSKKKICLYLSREKKNLEIKYIENIEVQQIS